MKLRVSITAALSIMLNQLHVTAIHPKVSMNAMNPEMEDYIVVYNDGPSTQSVIQRADAISKANPSIAVSAVYDKAINGFAAKMTLEDAEALAESNEIAYIAQDAYVNATQITWGLDRVDQETLPLDDSFSPDGDGTGVTAYIIDTGIRTDHTDFQGRAEWGKNTVDDIDTDCNGHGTHVASTVGGSEYGVAKGVKLVAVKVLKCNGGGTATSVIDGINWVMNHYIQTGKEPSTANLSLGGGSYQPLDTAVNNMHNSGIVTVVAAGNNNGNACNYSPAGASDVITVGSTTSSDSRSSFSNWGSCVDIMAPGSLITAAWYTSATALKTISGTSMASPHVCGGAALHLGDGMPAADVASKLFTTATTGQLSGLNGSPDLLLHVGETAVSTSSPTVSPSSAPTVSPVASTSNPTVSPSSAPTVSPVASTTNPTVSPSSAPTVSPVASTTNPTVSPSSAPTVSPVASTSSPTSLAPTENPTMEPSNGTGQCIDSPTDIFFRNRRLSCSRLSKGQCRNSSWFSHCPVKCGKCQISMCADSKKRFFRDRSGGRKFRCRSLKNKNERSKRRFCSEPNIAETCRASCNYC